jgi:hypothetical protein
MEIGKQLRVVRVEPLHTPPVQVKRPPAPVPARPR